MTFDGMSLETAGDEGEVEVTIRIPEQLFTRKYPKKDWDDAVAGKSVGDLTDYWRSDIGPDEEVYGPDGHQVPLW